MTISVLCLDDARSIVPGTHGADSRLPQRGARAHSALHQQVIEDGSRHNPRIRSRQQSATPGRPRRQVEWPTVRRHDGPTNPGKIAKRQSRHAEPQRHSHRAGADQVAARLVPRKRLPVEQQHGSPGPPQRNGCGAASRPRADHDRVEHLTHCCSRPGEMA
jgi:hypothetical protein